MMFKSHLAIAAGGYLVALDFLSDKFEQINSQLILGGALTLIGASLPDLDHPGSFIGQRFRFISKPISFVFGHRGLTHSIIPLAVILFVYGQSAPYWLLWLCFGYAMHLVGDYLTDSGIPLCYPITKKRFKFLLVTKTNTIGEPILVTVFLVACFLWVFL
ncbi:metal-dependent hydrolase [Pseudoalteromonas sp. NZS71]|uniref:metal-dependent hydrolase n=1 Tax=unclassified Pseudoalteromonas TaxID=194690 RepID=UPI00046406B6|nr:MULTISPECIES: metal-dependent hydrolase [unclassified Pseudoalteromonas]MBH0061783.1 metal-dependent hydrolase [Pseudoalteromonas sp. NZS71]